MNDKFLNIYVIMMKIITKRILWDMSLESIRSRRIINKYHNKYKGKTAIIMCNGPSLLKVDFDTFPSDVYVFGLNKINLLFDKTSFRPNFIVSVNQHVIEQNAGFFNETSIPLFMDSKGQKKLISRDNVAFIPSILYPSFSNNASYGLYQGYTVTYVALQLAYHMGFTKVALVGCDHNFSAKGPSNATVNAGEKDPDHFDPRYFAGGVKWQLPDLIQSEISYLMALDAYQKDNREIYNCTDGGKLELFPRMSLEEFFRSYG